jgi:hypothetical protein
MNEQPLRTSAPDQLFGRRNDRTVIDAMLAYAQTRHSDLPVTTAVALDAAADVRERTDG